jgi:hypothetical protein
LQDNSGNNLSISANGSFMFITAIASGGAYNVAVLTQPSSPAQACGVTNGSGKASAIVTSVQVACTTAPTITISLDPATITFGKTSTLSWSSSNSNSCAASGAWTGSMPTSGSQVVTPVAAGTATYTLDCTGSGGGITDAANLVVQLASAPAPVIPQVVNSTTFTLYGDDISSIASADLFGDGSQTIIIGSETFSTNWTTTARFSALKVTASGQITDVSNTFERSSSYCRQKGLPDAQRGSCFLESVGLL